MKRIIKKNPPPSLKKWRDGQNGINLTYDTDLTPKVKADIKQSLLEEQGYICCYTGKYVDAETSHIEHLKPRAESRRNGDHDDISYENMLAAYPKQFTEKDKATKEKFVTECPYGAAARHDWYDSELFVHPLRPDCESRFQFTLTGEISAKAENDAGAKQTIDRLNLKHEYLVADRKTAIYAFLIEDELSEAQVRQLHQGVMKRNTAGKFRPFCFVLAQACEIYLKRKQNSRNARIAIQRQNINR